MSLRNRFVSVDPQPESANNEREVIIASNRPRMRRLPKNINIGRMLKARLNRELSDSATADWTPSLMMTLTLAGCPLMATVDVGLPLNAQVAPVGRPVHARASEAFSGPIGVIVTGTLTRAIYPKVYSK